MVKKLTLNKYSFLFFLILILLEGCKPRDYSKIPAYSRNHFLQAVIEIPAGTNLKISYCILSHRFRVETMDGAERKVNYLPYPANFGFIPSTLINKAGEGKGDMIDVVVISDKLEVGTVIEIIPVGMLVIKDDFLTDYKVLAIPSDMKMQVVSVNTFPELNSTYPRLTEILEEWFLHSGFYKNAIILGWEDEHVARNFVEKWMVKGGNRSF